MDYSQSPIFQRWQEVGEGKNRGKHLLMKRDVITSLTVNFEIHSHQTETGVEFWLARDLQHLLGYAAWRNFIAVVDKAKTTCEVSGQVVSDHFVGVDKMVALGPGSQREIDDVMLTRFACYLVAQNGDPRKNQIAFAQTYFAMQTRKAEQIEQRLLELERVSARKKLTQTEKNFSSVIYEQTGQNKDFGLIRSKGDQALFRKTTQEMKSMWKVPNNKPLADFAPTIILKAKDFAAEITIHNAHKSNLQTENSISTEHISNNDAVRKTLLERGIRPESLPADEDIRKVERRLTSETKKSLKNIDGLGKENFEESL